MAYSDRIDAERPPVPALADDPASSHQGNAMEDQLARIIIAAREVAIVAEELLREVSQRGDAAELSPHALAMAPRLLVATQQQLTSVAAMLRQN